MSAAGSDAVSPTATTEVLAIEPAVAGVRVRALEAVRAARAAQRAWAALSVPRRLAVLRRLRGRIAAEADSLAAACGRRGESGKADSTAAEVLPLADALRFVERRARDLLAPWRPGSAGRPAWLAGVELEVRREPLGVVLVIGPANYPLLLPGIQALQALAAGNAVVVKPGCGGAPAIARLAALAVEAGLDPRLLAVLSEEPEAARAAIGAGVDRVVLTGSAETGRALLADLAPRLVPATVELSGCDAAVVRADADLDRAAAAIALGLRLNGGATCIAPRRVLVHAAVAEGLASRLADRARGLPAATVPAVTRARIRELATAACSAGARALCGAQALGEDEGTRGGEIPPFSDLATMLPLVLAGVPPTSPLLSEDLMAPVVSIVPVAGDDEAVRLAAASPYALGATVFTRDRAAAQRLTSRLRAGVVVVNDAIVPTADPRLPFGGRGASGFGVTRGAEGLLEMTAVKAVAIRHGRSARHLAPPEPGDGELFAGWVALAHGAGFQARAGGLLRLMRELGRRLAGAARAKAAGRPLDRKLEGEHG